MIRADGPQPFVLPMRFSLQSEFVTLWTLNFYYSELKIQSSQKCMVTQCQRTLTQKGQSFLLTFSSEMKISLKMSWSGIRNLCVEFFSLGWESVWLSKLHISLTFPGSEEVKIPKRQLLWVKTVTTVWCLLKEKTLTYWTMPRFGLDFIWKLVLVKSFCQSSCRSLGCSVGLRVRRWNSVVQASPWISRQVCCWGSFTSFAVRSNDRLVLDVFFWRFIVYLLCRLSVYSQRILWFCIILRITTLSIRYT